MRHILLETVEKLLASGKGILAADESNSTLAKRFTTIGVPNTENFRRDYRKLLFTTEGLERCVSGVIFFDETLRQKDEQGRPLREFLTEKGIVPGIKVDKGTVDLPGRQIEKVTEGLDGLGKRLAEYRESGARFAKWRAVIKIESQSPSSYALRVNAEILARYARICQEEGIVPIVEPEVLMDGAHAMERCAQVTEETLHHVFVALHEAGVEPEAMLLKPNMVLPGKESSENPTLELVAATTLNALRRTVPASVPGICFLSGGQSPQAATARLQKMVALGPHPWELSFSFSRALQEPVLAAWEGRPERLAEAQSIFRHRLEMAAAARSGRYASELETASDPVYFNSERS